MYLFITGHSWNIDFGKLVRMHFYQFLPHYCKLTNGDHVVTEKKKKTKKPRTEELKKSFNWNNYNCNCTTRV